MMTPHQYQAPSGTDGKKHRGRRGSAPCPASPSGLHQPLLPSPACRASSSPGTGDPGMGDGRNTKLLLETRALCCRGWGAGDSSVGASRAPLGG